MATAADYNIVSYFDSRAAVYFTCPRCGGNKPDSQFRRAVHPPTSKFIGKFALSKTCKLCERQRRGEWVNHPLYSPALDTYFSSKIPVMKANAKARKILFGITKDEIVGLFLKQEGRCAVSGLKLTLEKGGIQRGHSAILAASVDRIDSRGCYTIDNVWIVAGAVNIMKNEYTMETFASLCSAVVSHQSRLARERENELLLAIA